MKSASIRLLVIGYVALLHGVLLVLVLKTNFLLLAGKTLGLVPPEEWTLDFASRILKQANDDRTVPAGKVILIGDSIMAQLDGRLICSDVVNFGLGGDTTRTLRDRMPVIRSIQQSRAVVLEVGVNDLKYRTVDQIARDYDGVLHELSTVPSIFALSVLPVDESGPAARHRPYLRNERIAAMNTELERVCSSHFQCHFLNVWPVMRESAVYAADGWHLSAEGNRRLAGIIRSVLSTSECAAESAGAGGGGKPSPPGSHEAH